MPIKLFKVLAQSYNTGRPEIESIKTAKEVMGISDHTQEEFEIIDIEGGVMGFGDRESKHIATLLLLDINTFKYRSFTNG